jgi:hypothetical protein
MLHRRQDRQRREAGGAATFLQRQFPTDFAANHVLSVYRSVTADVDKISVHDAPEIVTRGWEDCWKLETKFDKAI